MTVSPITVCQNQGHLFPLLQLTLIFNARALLLFDFPTLGSNRCPEDISLLLSAAKESDLQARDPRVAPEERLRKGEGGWGSAHSWAGSFGAPPCPPLQKPFRGHHCQLVNEPPVTPAWSPEENSNTQIPNFHFKKRTFLL